MSLSEVANRVIDLDRKIQEYYAAELPKRHPHYPLVGPGEEEPPPPPEELALGEFLATLPGEMLYQLLFIVYLGRGEVGRDEWLDYYERMKDDNGAPTDVAALLMLYKVTLADELADGLEELHKRKINIDRMPLKRPKMRKR